MRFVLTMFLAAFLVLASARPSTKKRRVPIFKRSNLVNRDKSINLEALYAQVEHTKAKIHRGLQNFEKNTGATYPSILKTTQKRATGAVPLTDYQNVLWYGTISVGTPPNTFTVDFDTGSRYALQLAVVDEADADFSDLFLPGPNCGSTCSGHKAYDPSSSSTSQDLGQSYTLSYGGEGSNTVDVEEYTDTISISGLTANKQALGVATQYSTSESITYFPPDGLLGMGFQQISTADEPPPFQTLVSQGQTDAPVFAFKLSQSGAELSLGGVNTALYTGDFTYTPVTTVGYWEVNLDAIVGNGQTIWSNINSIVDTGTTLIIGDPIRVELLYGMLGGTPAPSIGDGYYTFPCDAFPSISLTFGGTSFTISESTLNLGPVSSGSSVCASGIIGPDTYTPFWVIGDVFLQNVYTVFDVGNTRVGFATLA